jgi:hypothetical protein
MNKEKPFYTIYMKERNKLNPIRWILGKFKFNWYEKGRQPQGYKNAFDVVFNDIDLNANDIKIVRNNRLKH